MRWLRAITVVLFAACCPLHSAGDQILATTHSGAATDSASPGEPLTLEKAIQIALDHNPELRLLRERITAATGRAVQARLWPNPELEASAEDLPVGAGGFSQSKNLLGLSQTIPFPGKKSLDRRIGGLNVRVSEENFRLRRIELVRGVKIAFVRALANERVSQIAGDLVRVTESSAGVARERVTAGAAPLQEQLRAEVQSEQARTQLAAAHGELETARQALATLLGRPELQRTALSGSLSESTDPALLNSAGADWLRSHPGIAAARTARDRAGVEYRRANLDPWPDVTLGVAGGRGEARDETLAEFRISIPLPVFDRAQGKKREAQANAAIAEAELAATELRLLSQQRALAARVRVAADQVAAYRDRILPKANQALQLVQEGFDQGEFAFVDLLDTQRTTAETRMAYEQRLLELNLAQAELEALMDRENY